MSCVPVDVVEEVCANCGKEGSDGVTLKKCNACFLVKYCGVDCQKVHRKQHKKACKERAAELKDEELYNQGTERVEADFCPLCLLATPIPMNEHSRFYTCCMKRVCDGCIYAAKKGGLGKRCPFCRILAPDNDAEMVEMMQKRVDAKDPAAIDHLGDLCYNGMFGLEKDESRGIKLWSEAAELGMTKAHFNLGTLFFYGRGGVTQDKAKAILYWEDGAKQGDAMSRHMLGLVEMGNVKVDRAVRHFVISAKMGYDNSLDALKEIFASGYATKQQYVEALKGYQDAMEETKSPQRDEAARIGFTKFGKSEAVRP